MMSRIILVELLFLAVVSAQRSKALEKRDRMSVWEPEALKMRLEDKASDIDFKVGNFGNIPWGKTILGTVIVPKDEYGCDAPDKAEVKEMLDRKNETKFVLMKRGNCSFVQKAFNAQILGANLVIFRNSDSSDVHQLEMVSDGSITELDIPALLIDKDQGKKIHDFTKEYHGMSKSEREKTRTAPPTLSVYFHWSKTDDVHYDIWMSSGEDNSMKFFRDFAPKIKNLSSASTTFAPHYVQLECFWCSMNNYQSEVENCFSGGRYCAIDPDGDAGLLDGREVLKEDIRQICIYKIYKQTIFLDYASKFYEKCLKDFKNKNKETLTSCSHDLMKETGIYKERIDDCYRDSWNFTREVKGTDGKIETIVDTEIKERLQDNHLLKTELKKWKAKSLGVWPSVVVNKIAFKGDLNPDRIYEAICRSFNNPPKECNMPDFREIPANPDAYRGGRKTFWKLFGLIIGGLIGVMTLFFFIYRRYVRRAMTEEMNEQINSAVSAYFRMGESSRLGKSQTA